VQLSLWRQLSSLGQVESKRNQGSIGMTVCPECGGSDLESSGILRGERVDNEHTVLVSKFKCRQCGCEFKEYMITSWQTEIIASGKIERLMMLEAEEFSTA